MVRALSATGPHHLGWIAIGAAVGFTSSFVFADLLHLPTPAFHVAYFLIVGGFVILYVHSTRLDVRAVLRHRLRPALVLGILGWLILVRRVVADPPSVGLTGAWYAGDLIGRGLVYGAVDGVLLSSFPWLVVWRAMGGESGSFVKRVQLNILVLTCVLVMTSAYHAGYPAFRGGKRSRRTSATSSRLCRPCSPLTQ